MLLEARHQVFKQPLKLVEALLGLLRVVSQTPARGARKRDRLGELRVGDRWPLHARPSAISPTRRAASDRRSLPRLLAGAPAATLRRFTAGSRAAFLCRVVPGIGAKVR